LSISANTNFAYALHSVAVLVALFCFYHSFTNVKTVVKLVKYCGASRDDEYMYLQLIKAERDVKTIIKNERGGEAIKLAMAEQKQE